MKSSNCHSLIVWQCLVGYILEFELFCIKIYKLNKFISPKSCLFTKMIRVKKLNYVQKRYIFYCCILMVAKLSYSYKNTKNPFNENLSCH